MKRLIVMTGLPGSGKDTWIEHTIRNNPDMNYQVVSTDSYLEKIAKENGITYNEAFSYIKEAESFMMKRAQELANVGANVIWNQTNLTEKKRRKISNMFGHYDERTSITVLIDEDVHKQRLEERAAKEGKNIAPHIIENMRKTFSEPSHSENFDNFCIFDNSGSEFKLVKMFTNKL